MKHFLLTAVLFIPSVLFAQTQHPLTFDDLIGFGRVSDPQISPDGKWIVYVVTRQLKEENKSTGNIFITPVSGGEPKQLTNAPGSNANPCWMPDGKTIAFVSSRDGESQIWTISIDGGEAKEVTHIASGISGLILSPDGKWFAFSADVYPDCKDEESSAKKAEAVEKSKVKAKIFTHLTYRVWNDWKDGKRSHLFIVPSSGGKLLDLTPGDYDTPPIDLGGSCDYAFSPDSREIAFTRNPDKMVAVSTNNEIYTVPVTGGEPKNISENPANDSQPVYSPDGRYLAYRMTRRPGFEADKHELILFDRKIGKKINLTETQDYSVGDVVWSPDSKTLYWTSDDKGSISIFKVTVNDTKILKILDHGFNTALRADPNGRYLVFDREQATFPAEIFRMDPDGGNLTQITSTNSERIKSLAVNPIEPFWFEGAGGIKVEGFLLKPPHFDAAKKYPLTFLVHGGPQGAWGDDFHYRWNSEMFASRGAVVVMINPRGSTGYGQKFTDEISRDWGGKAYEDLMMGLDYVLKTYPFVDSTRMAAAGASYGGYMMNWILGHTNRFKCIVSHDGMFNPFSAYGTTEELWFNEWEFGGTPYDHPELYAQWSPMAFVKNFKTPTLVIHGQLDYRLDVSEGFQLFTALQRQGVESKMLYFPDEGHFVLKPQNSELWYTTVLDWIGEHTK
jgi:dipeptidyl aminopeptidase/acylaminoacyl peptidase